MTPARHPGLDTLRAIAIALVFAHHYMLFVSREPTFGWISVIGWVGVDLFFVLSGYLITQQLLAGMTQDRRLCLRRFYARRALRTLPVFWVVLAAYFLWPAQMGGSTPPPLWRFLTFTQNFQLPPGTAFSHAWSLCVEEQFYLVLPLAVLAGWRWGRGRAAAWWLLGLLIALGITARGLLWQRYGLEALGQIDGYHRNIYYATLCRFDEFLPGVAVALLQHRHPQRWAWLMAHGHALMALGVAATAAMFYAVLHHYYVDEVGYGFFMTTFGYSLIALAFAPLVLAALSPQSWLHGVPVPGAASIARWSFAIYLSHKAVGHIAATQLRPFEPAPATLLAVVLPTTLLVGWALYRVVETPFMRLRARWVPSLFSPRAPTMPTLPDEPRVAASR